MDSADNTLQFHLDDFRGGRNVAADQVPALFDALIGSDNEDLLADTLNAWNEKGTTEDELFELAWLMRSRMKRIVSRHETFVDVVGTGGSESKTFNVSTAAAFVIAGSGLPVAKHGNRAATSNSGSADALDELRIGLDMGHADAERHLDDIGICFMFAPRYHSLSHHLAKARRSIGKPTIFNNLGPLCNPASAPHQVIGVWSEVLVEKTANVLARLGTKRSWVVYGENGLDEIALTGKTQVAEINDGRVTKFSISASDFGVDGVGGEVPSNCSAQESAALIEEMLNNRRVGDAAETIVLINAAAAIYVSGNADGLPKAYRLAETSIRTGSALEKLNLLRAESTK